MEREQKPELLNEGGAPMRNLLKDLQFVTSAAESTGLRTPIASAAQKEYEAASAAGHDAADIAILYNL